MSNAGSEGAKAERADAEGGRPAKAFIGSLASWSFSTRRHRSLHVPTRTRRAIRTFFFSGTSGDGGSRLFCDRSFHAGLPPKAQFEEEKHSRFMAGEVRKAVSTPWDWAHPFGRTARGGSKRRGLEAARGLKMDLGRAPRGFNVDWLSGALSLIERLPVVQSAQPSVHDEGGPRSTELGPNAFSVIFSFSCLPPDPVFLLFRSSRTSNTLRPTSVRPSRTPLPPGPGGEGPTHLRSTPSHPYATEQASSRLLADALPPVTELETFLINPLTRVSPPPLFLLLPSRAPHSHRFPPTSIPSSSPYKPRMQLPRDRRVVPQTAPSPFIRCFEKARTVLSPVRLGSLPSPGDASLRGTSG